MTKKKCIFIVLFVFLIWILWSNTALELNYYIVQSDKLPKAFDGFCILISHRPEFFNEYVATGVDLVLSGHTHGGQFRIPFVGGLVAPHQGFFPKYDVGMYTENNTSMIVSRGIGNSIIPIRFNNRPEVIVIKLQAS